MKDIYTYLKRFSKDRLLVVFPHPDDESVMAGGLILKAINLGWSVSVLTLTEGGNGKIHINGKGRSTKEIRRSEMAKAMSILGVVDWVMWRFEDGKLRKQEKWKERLRKFIEITDPDLIVTYDLSGVSGHPDHISLGLEIIREAKKKNIRLLWPSFVDEEKSRVSNKKVAKYMQRAEVVSELNLKESYLKWSAAFAHKSQGLEKFVKMPKWLAIIKKRKEYYSEMKREKKYNYRYVKFRM